MESYQGPHMTFKATSTKGESCWLPTSRAAMQLGCSPEHLKRQRDTKGGFLEAGTHYSLGASVTAPITWDVQAVREAFHRRGVCARQELG